MSTPQVKSQTNRPRGWKTYVWPCVLGDRSKTSVNLWGTIHGSSWRRFKVVSTMPFVYKFIQVIKENLTQLNAREWMLEIIADHWDRTLKHLLHAIGN